VIRETPFFSLRHFLLPRVKRKVRPTSFWIANLLSVLSCRVSVFVATSRLKISVCSIQIALPGVAIAPDSPSPVFRIFFFA